MKGFITSSETVRREFFKIFLELSVNKKLLNSEHPFIQIKNSKGDTFDTLVKYYRRGNVFNAEKEIVYYPVIIIKDFPPVRADNYYFPVSNRETGIQEIDGAKERDIVVNPLKMVYKFQVSVVTEKITQYDALFDYFTNVFIDIKDTAFKFLKETAGENELYYPVVYNTEVSTNEREDYLYAFSVDFKLFIDLYTKKDNRDLIHELTKVSVTSKKL